MKNPNMLIFLLFFFNKELEKQKHRLPTKAVQAKLNMTLFSPYKSLTFDRGRMETGKYVTGGRNKRGISPCVSVSKIWGG